MNLFTAVGNLGRDWEIFRYESGKVKGLNAIATKSGKDETFWLELEVWGKQAETLASHTQKGSTILIEAELKTEKWQDRTTGQDRSKVLGKVNRFQFVGARERKPDNATTETNPRSWDDDDIVF